MLLTKNCFSIIINILLIFQKVSSNGCGKNGETWICKSLQLEMNKKLPLTETNLNVKNIKFEKCIIPIVPIGVFTSFKNIKTIDLENNGIQIVTPRAFEGLTQLNKLHLRSNEITELRKNVLNTLTNVKELNLHHNRINTLDPGCFTNMSQLELLRLGWNKLKYIPENVFIGLKNLKYVFLNNNLILEVAANGFKDLPTLYQLDIEHNSITKLPFVITSKCLNLGILNLEYNNISEINENIFSALNNLNKLHISNNKISFLNFQKLLEFSPKLKDVGLNNNSWHCSSLSNNLQILKIHNVIVNDNNTKGVSNLNGVKCDPNEEVTTENINILEKLDKAINDRFSNFDLLENIRDIFNSTTNYINYIFLRYFEDGFKNTTFYKYFQQNFSNTNFCQQFDGNFTKLISEPLQSDRDLSNGTLMTLTDGNILQSLGTSTFIGIYLVIVIVILLIITALLCTMFVCMCIQRRRFSSVSQRELLL